MIATIQNALTSTVVDERQMSVLVSGACPHAALAALGVMIGQVVSVIRRDRKMIRTWLTTADRASA